MESNVAQGPFQVRFDNGELKFVGSMREVLQMGFKHIEKVSFSVGNERVILDCSENGIFYYDKDHNMTMNMWTHSVK